MSNIFWTGKLSLPTKILINLNCAFAFLKGNTKNIPAMKHRIKLGYSGTVSKYIKRYDEMGLPHYGRVAEMLLAGIDVRGKTILDVGCGTGIASFGALESGASKILGIDISRTMIQQCIEKFKDKRFNSSTVEFRECDAEFLNVKDNSFQIALSNLVLGFAPNQFKIIREMIRVVKHGGWIAIATHGPKHYWEACDATLRVIGKLYALGYRMEFWPRKTNYIKNLFLKAGLTNIKTSNIVWEEKFTSSKQAYDFFASTSGLWWYAKFPPEERKTESAKIRAYFKRKGITKITSDVILAYGRKP